MKRQEEQQFYKLLRLSLGLTQEFPVDVDADGWRRLYQTAILQSLVGVCYQGVCLLPEGCKPPVEIAMQWASEAESIEAIRRAYDYGCTFFDTAEGYDSSDAMVARLQKAGKETFTLENLKKMYFSTSGETTGISEKFRFPDEPFTDDITVCV